MDKIINSCSNIGKYVCFLNVFCSSLQGKTLKNKDTGTIPFKFKKHIFNLFNINRLQSPKMGVTDFLELVYEESLFIMLN